jgi:hypothetical protein
MLRLSLAALAAEEILGLTRAAGKAATSAGMAAATATGGSSIKPSSNHSFILLSLCMFCVLFLCCDLCECSV